MYTHLVVRGCGVTDEQVIGALKQRAVQAAPHMLIATLSQAIGRDPTQFEFITYFKRAFVCIPLSALTEASTSRQIVGEAGLADEDFDHLLRPHIEASLGTSSPP